MTPAGPHFAHWLEALSAASLIVAGLCAAVIAVDLVRRPQKMWIMNLVWPLCALFGSVAWLAAYWRWGRNSGGDEGEKPAFAVSVFKGASHCGAGCTLGDLVGEWLAVAAPVLLAWFGWGWLFQEKAFAAWLIDFVFAFGFGIVFQYFTIAPMRGLSPAAGIAAAVKADILSITSWQIGMYGLMALLQFGWYRPAFGGTAPPASVEFWFAMQLAMLAGFATAYPVNWWLIRAGAKEEM